MCMGSRANQSESGDRWGSQLQGHQTRYSGRCSGVQTVHFFCGIAVWDYALNLAGWGDGEVWTGSCPCPASRARAKGEGLTTLVTSGLSGIPSSASAALQSSLESRLMPRLDSAGSTLFVRPGSGGLRRCGGGTGSTQRGRPSHPAAAVLLCRHRRARYDGRRAGRKRTAQKRENGVEQSANLNECVLASVADAEGSDHHRAGWCDAAMERTDGTVGKITSALDGGFDGGDTPSEDTAMCGRARGTAGYAACPSELGVEIDAKCEGLEGHFGDVRDWRGPGWLDPHHGSISCRDRRNSRLLG